MSQLISSFPIGSIFYQSGYGYPTHIATRGCTYIDVNTGIEYINKDGIVDWVPFLDGSTVITGGTTTGNFLPLSGGTVYGPTNFTSGLTVNYIDFDTTPTVPNPTGGTLYFDSTENALSYKPITNQNDVTVNLGQESLIRIYNDLGYQINNGQVLHITGSTGGIPTVALANASKLSTSITEGVAQSSGVATHDIPNGQYGFMTNFGVVRDLNTSGFTAGDEVYLSDTVDGALTNNPYNIALTSRVSTVGFCLESSPTNGKILVVITNENAVQSLTQKEVNVLLGNTISTGVYQYTGMTQGTGQTINVAFMRGWIVQNTYSYAIAPKVTNIYYTGGTNIPLTYLSSADATYIFVNSGSTLYQQTTFPTPQQRRENIFLGKVVHPNRSTITSINQTVDFDVSPMSAIRDIWTPLKLINQGVVVSPHSTTLEINTSAGTLWGNGIGWTTNQLNPDSINISGTSPTTFQYRSRLGPITGGTAPYTGNTTFIDPSHYDNNGVISNVGGGSNSSTNQRVYLFPTGLIRIQYGQQVYGSLAAAVAGSQTEQFVEYGNNRDNGVLIGIISVNKNATNLSNIAQAVFNFVSKFGEIMGGTGGLSTTTLQQAYDNSSPPEITTNSTLGALSIKNGTGNADNVTNILESLNTSGNTTSFIRADGSFSGSSVSAVTIQTPSFRANANGLTATTISATTITLPFTSGSTLFAGTSGQILQNNFQYFWDNVNNRLGVGTNSPQAKLDVASSTGSTAIHITSSALTNSDMNFINSGYPLPRWTIRATGIVNGNSGNLVFQRLGGTYVMSITENQNVLIGTTTDSGYKLDVIGTARFSGTTSIVGDISQTSPSFTGTHTIGFSANNSVRFTNSGIGSYMQVGPSNIVDFLGQNLQSVQRGATFGNTIASTGIVSITAMAAQSSGVINSSAIQFTHAINNTGTYSGITRGIFYNPTLTSLVGTTHRAIETVTGDVVLGSTSGSVLVGKTTNDGFRLDVSGTTRLSALTQNILTVIGSGNSTTSPIFSVQGSQGELFSVTDSLTGSLFSVNDISGLPILEVFSDNTTLMGNYLAPSLNTTARVVLTAGTNTIYSIPVSAYTGAFFDYTVSSTGTTGVRAGTVTSVWSGTTAEFTDISTNDIGVTSGVTFSVISNGTLARLSSSATTSGWIVKTIIRSI
jgi:hypothetical protein